MVQNDRCNEWALAQVCLITWHCCRDMVHLCIDIFINIWMVRDFHLVPLSYSVVERCDLSFPKGCEMWEQPRCQEVTVAFIFLCPAICTVLLHWWTQCKIKGIRFQEPLSKLLIYYVNISYLVINIAMKCKQGCNRASLFLPNPGDDGEKIHWLKLKAYYNTLK